MKNNSNSNSESKILYILRRTFKVRQWFDWERTRSFSFFVSNAMKRVFTVDVNQDNQKKEGALLESFESARQKLNLSDKDLLKRQRALLCWSFLMSLMALLICAYGFYHLYLGNIRAGFCSLIMMTIAIALAFRYHFWYYQFKNHKLGCSVQEWFKNGVLGEKNE